MKYLVTLSFLDPTEGITIVEANSPDEAREKASVLFQNRQNLNIVDVKEYEEPTEEDLFGYLSTLDKKDIN